MCLFPGRRHTYLLQGSFGLEALGQDLPEPQRSICNSQFRSLNIISQMCSDSRYPSSNGHELLDTVLSHTDDDHDALLRLVHANVEAHSVDPEAHVALAGQISLTQCPAFILSAGFESRDRRAADRLLAPGPNNASNASCMAPVDIPFSDSQGNTYSTLRARLRLPKIRRQKGRGELDPCAAAISDLGRSHRHRSYTCQPFSVRASSRCEPRACALPRPCIRRTGLAWQTALYPLA